ENASGRHALANHGQAVHVVKVELTVEEHRELVPPVGETGHEPDPPLVSAAGASENVALGPVGSRRDGQIAEQTLGIVHDTDATLDHAQRAGIAWFCRGP